MMRTRAHAEAGARRAPVEDAQCGRGRAPPAGARAPGARRGGRNEGARRGRDMRTLPRAPRGERGAWVED